MYRVIIVDDEPIVLSGIKFLVDWENGDLTLAGTARNGQQALEMIQNGQADIVICDINMPVMSGLQLLKETSELPFSPVFIMLTNHSEFDMARESLRYEASDYLLKSQLEQDNLMAALENAKKVFDKRKKISNMDFSHKMEEADKGRLIASSMRTALDGSSGDTLRNLREALTKCDACNNYLLIQVLLDYSPLPKEINYSQDDIKRIYEIELEILNTLLPKVFHDYTLFRTDERHNGFTIFCWNVTGDAANSPNEKLFAKLVTSSANLTDTRISSLVTQPLDGADRLEELIRQAHILAAEYYRSDSDYLVFHGEAAPEVQPLAISPISNRLVFELRSKNIVQSKEYLDKIQQTFAQTPHTRDDAIQNCCELFGLVSTVLTPMMEKDTTNEYFSQISQGIGRIQHFINYKQVAMWLDDFAKQVLATLEQLTSTKYELGEKIKRYIRENVEDRIMLQDVATHVSVSPSYLSALFKKQYGQNLVDYINEQRMERACELIREGKYRIYEISLKLSFENAYYFTKVFKRHIGMTPKEYKMKVHGTDNE